MDIMAAPALYPIMLFALASISVGGLLAALLYPQLARPSRFKRRFCTLAASTPTKSAAAPSDDGRDRRRSVEKTIRELEQKQKDKSRKAGRPSLSGRLRQAGLAWTKRTYILLCLACGLAGFVVAAFLGPGPLPAVGFGFSAGLLLPHLYVTAKRKRRFRAFSNEFANAVDVVVRGLKAGLPLADCLKIIANEARDPVKSEFVLIVQDQTLGIPLDEAVERLWERVPLAETNFFAIVIAVQARAGGSLSEALGNLAKVLRERKKMQSKIKAMSSEAKSSAGIIGALPFLVSGAVYITSPDYMSLIFTTQTGNLVLAGCGLWMGTGILVMRKMINFDF